MLITEITQFKKELQRLPRVGFQREKHLKLGVYVAGTWGSGTPGYKTFWWWSAHSIISGSIPYNFKCPDMNWHNKIKQNWTPVLLGRNRTCFKGMKKKCILADQLSRKNQRQTAVYTSLYCASPCPAFVQTTHCWWVRLPLVKHQIWLANRGKENKMLQELMWMFRFSSCWR